MTRLTIVISLVFLMACTLQEEKPDSMASEPEICLNNIVYAPGEMVEGYVLSNPEVLNTSLLDDEPRFQVTFRPPGERYAQVFKNSFLLAPRNTPNQILLKDVIVERNDIGYFSFVLPDTLAPDTFMLVTEITYPITNEYDTGLLVGKSIFVTLE